MSMELSSCLISIRQNIVQSSYQVTSRLISRAESGQQFGAVYSTSKFLHCLLVPSEPVQLMWPPRDVQTLCSPSNLPSAGSPVESRPSESFIFLFRSYAWSFGIPACIRIFPPGLVNHLRHLWYGMGMSIWVVGKRMCGRLAVWMFFWWRILGPATFVLGLYYWECLFHDELLRLQVTDVYRHVHSNICECFLGPMSSSWSLLVIKSISTGALSLGSLEGINRWVTTFALRCIGLLALGAVCAAQQMNGDRCRLYKTWWHRPAVDASRGWCRSGCMLILTNMTHCCLFPCFLAATYKCRLVPCVSSDICEQSSWLWVVKLKCLFICLSSQCFILFYFHLGRMIWWAQPGKGKGTSHSPLAATTWAISLCPATVKRYSWVYRDCLSVW